MNRSLSVRQKQISVTLISNKINLQIMKITKLNTIDLFPRSKFIINALKYSQPLILVIQKTHLSISQKSISTNHTVLSTRTHVRSNNFKLRKKITQLQKIKILEILTNLSSKILVYLFPISTYKIIHNRIQIIIIEVAPSNLIIYNLNLYRDFFLFVYLRKILNFSQIQVVP